MFVCGYRISLRCLILALFSSVIISLGPVQAEKKRHHGAHEHGVAHLNVAIEGNNIYIEFFSPAVNIVGFEHHPRTHEQKNAVKDAVNKLKNGASLFLLSARSESYIVNSSVETDIDKDADHTSESEHDHDPAEKGHHGEVEHEHAEKEHSQDHEHESHSEFEAEYHFTFKKPGKLSQIDVRLFSVFPGIEHIEVQLLKETKQTAMELTAKKYTISL